ncbi:MAG: hypothetical protein ACLUD2_12030 [Clostridium sp.]
MARLRWLSRAKSSQRRKRDLALVMDKDITCGQVEDCIREGALASLKDVTLFDV